MKKFAALIAIISLAKFSVSSDEGTSAASFMKIDSAARPAALAGAFTALADDATAVHYNPAGIGFLNQKEVSFSHNEWFESIRLESLSYAHPVNRNLTLGFGMNYLFSDSVDETDGTGAYTGDSFNTSGGTIMLGIAGRIGNYFSLGLNAKTIWEKLAGESGFAYGADAGFLFKNHFTDGFISLGAGIQNLGTKLKLYEDSFNIPLKYSGGAAAAYRYITATLVADKARDEDVVIRTGLEFNSKDLVKEAKIALRLGYRTETADEAGPGITTGIGIGVSDFNLDYAFVPMGELGSTHRVTVSLKFGTIRGERKFERKDKPEITTDKKDTAASEPEPRQEQLIIPDMHQQVSEVEPDQLPMQEQEPILKEEPQTLIPDETVPAKDASQVEQEILPVETDMPKQMPPEEEGIILTEDIAAVETPKSAEPVSREPKTDFDTRFEKPQKVSVE